MTDEVSRMVATQEAINCNVIAGKEIQRQLGANAQRCAVNVNESNALYERLTLTDDGGINANLDTLNKEISNQDKQHKGSLTASAALSKQLAKTPIIGLKAHVGYFAVTVDGPRSFRTADQGILKRYYDSRNPAQLAVNRAAVDAKFPTDGVLFVMKVTAQYLDKSEVTGEYTARIRGYSPEGEKIKPAFPWFDTLTETVNGKDVITSEGRGRIDVWLNQLHKGHTTTIVATESPTEDELQKRYEDLMVRLDFQKSLKEEHPDNPLIDDAIASLESELESLETKMDAVVA